MLPGFGKQTIVIGSAPHCDVVLQGPGVAPEHARIVHQGNGRLVLMDAGAGQTLCNGQPLAPGAQAPFDFRTAFQCGGAQLPLNHPAVVLMLMAPGQQPAPPGQVIVGRDPTRSSLVIQHPSVSSQHATVMLDRMMVVDHGSTSGTWVGQNRIGPNAPTPMDPNGVVAFGPVPVLVSVLGQVLQGMAGGGVPLAATAGAPGMVPIPPGAPAPMGGAPMGGAPMGGAPASPSGVQASPYGSAQPYRKAQTVLGRLPMGAGSQTTIRIGRTPDNDIVVEHPQVSSRHAALIKRGSQLFLQDLRSANGTFVRGQRLPPGGEVPVSNGERVMIGPRPLLIQVEGESAQVVSPDVQGDWGNRPLYEIEAWGLTVEVPDRDNPGVMKRLLNEVSFKALPGDMIALMGPSGAGKTTLLMALNGYKPPSGGIVRVNGQDLYEIYDALRGSIGYVPQDDIVHPELTVFEAVKYSARFRLPPDYSEEEIDRQVMSTLSALGLDSLAHLQIGKPEKKVLSGGQRKRVNIALELVTDPVILFLDEPTSGLAADDTTALITLLSNVARSTGKTIIMTIHQPAKDEYERFNLALIMGYGGIPIFYGPTKPDSYKFFGSWKEKTGKPNDIDNPRDMFDMLRLRENMIFEQMKAQNPQIPKVEARKAACAAWQQEFQQTQTFRMMYSGSRQVGQGQSQRGIPDTGNSTTGQLWLLLSRYKKIKLRDVGGTAIMLLQAPIIGILLAFVFGGQDKALPFWCIGALQELKKKSGGGGGDLNTILAQMTTTTDHAGAMFFLVVSAIWFGTSNAAREIVSERAIYLRERMVNLGLFNYVASKFILLSIFCMIQCTVLLAIVFFTLGFNGGIGAFVMDLGYLTSVSVCAVVLGLLISTSVESSEAAMALTPIALIPQVVLGGMVVPMTTNETLKWLMFIIPARWGFQGVAAQERMAIADSPAWIMNLGNPSLNSPNDFLTGGKFYCAKAQLASDTFNGAWGFHQYEQTWLPFAVLLGMSFAQLALLLVLLKRRDPV
jgi:ABC-type multidrug transport system ATPase subunit/pSer/pThr/pTyr-binding forkhead associated (FHA) protein